MPSERPGHRIQEIWHPLGTVGIITSFNFPVAVWSWNFTIATICGNVTLWKPSPKTPITSLSVYRIWKNAVNRYKKKDSARNIFSIINGDKEQAEWIAKDKKIDLVSLTGSTEMGKNLGKIVTERFGKLIMELGGNNAMIVAPSADMNALGVTIIALLPPNSIISFPNLSVTIFPKFLPISVEPVRLTKSIFLSLAIHSPCSLSPLIILKIFLAESLFSYRFTAFFQIL
jgi:hypothetical protein